MSQPYSTWTEGEEVKPPGGNANTESKNVRQELSPPCTDALLLALPAP